MSSLDRISSSKPERSENESAIELRGERLISTIDGRDLARMKSGSSRAVAIPMVKKASQVVDALIPLASKAMQVAQTYDMAVVKFPEGVSWSDLCVRKSDGWNLLSNFKDGKFSDMAAIKQAGLQPSAVANLALQGAAVAVGMAYMNEINGKLNGIQSTINDIQRDMERERDAELMASYDALARLALKYDEYGARPEKRLIALQVIEDATREATKAWNYQIQCIWDTANELQSRKLTEEEVKSEAGKVCSMENRASAALRLIAAAQQMGMRIENDYTVQRIETDKQIVDKRAEEFANAHNAAQSRLSEKASEISGLPFLVADYGEDDYQQDNPVFDFLHDVGRAADRVNPLRMAEKAQQDLEERRSKLKDDIAREDIVRAIVECYENELETLRFAFNEADTVVFDGEEMHLLKSSNDEMCEEGSFEIE